MGRVRQAGAVAYCAASPEPLWLVATSRRAPSEWVFPKGHVEPAEDAAAAAVRELREEAGVTGRAVAPLGELSFRSGEEDVTVAYFLVESLAVEEAGEGRQLRWVSFPDAQRLLTHRDARVLLERAARRLSEGPS